MDLPSIGRRYLRTGREEAGGAQPQVKSINANKGRVKGFFSNSFYLEDDVNKRE